MRRTNPNDEPTDEQLGEMFDWYDRNFVECELAREILPGEIDRCIAELPHYEATLKATVVYRGMLWVVMSIRSLNAAAAKIAAEPSAMIESIATHSSGQSTEMGGATS